MSVFHNVFLAKYEQNIQSEYLQKIHDGYSNFIKTQKNINTLFIDVSELDFVTFLRLYFLLNFKYIIQF